MKSPDSYTYSKPVGKLESKCDVLYDKNMKFIKSHGAMLILFM